MLQGHFTESQSVQLHSHVKLVETIDVNKARGVKAKAKD